jgi:hypothetical protein
MHLSESADNLWRLVLKTLAATRAEDEALLAQWLPLEEARPPPVGPVGPRCAQRVGE